MSDNSPQRGTLFLVVGPSGAGKDSLIDAAKAAVGSDGGYVFPRRYITRPADAGGENHIPVSEALFDTMLERKALLLEWRAHNMRYGVPTSVKEHLGRRRHVVLNVSRTVVDQARAELAPVHVLYITVDDDILAQRLRARGRETERDIQRRVARAREYAITGGDVTIIDNSGPLKDTLRVFLRSIGYHAPAGADKV